MIHKNLYEYNKGTHQEYLNTQYEIGMRRKNPLVQSYQALQKYNENSSKLWATIYLHESIVLFCILKT